MSMIINLKDNLRLTFAIKNIFTVMALKNNYLCSSQISDLIGSQNRTEKTNKLCAILLQRSIKKLLKIFAFTRGWMKGINKKDKKPRKMK